MLIIFSRHPTCCWRERFQDSLLLFLWGFRGLWLNRQSKGFDRPQIHANVQNHAKPVSFFYSFIWFFFFLYMYFNSTWTLNFIWAAIYAMLPFSFKFPSVMIYDHDLMRDPLTFTPDFTGQMRYRPFWVVN